MSLPVVRSVSPPVVIRDRFQSSAGNVTSLARRFSPRATDDVLIDRLLSTLDIWKLVIVGDVMPNKLPKNNDNDK